MKKYRIYTGQSSITTISYKKLFIFLCFKLKVYNGIDLLALEGPTKEPTRYATRVAGILFSHEELLTRMIPPLSERTKKVEFNPEKVSMLKSKKSLTVNYY